MPPFTKPEDFLKQAEGLISMGQNHAALQSFTDIFSSKRFRSTPLPKLEPIFLRFVELCVDMREGRSAKEGLMKYKNIAQNVKVASIKVIIQRFLALADAKVQEAQERAGEVVAVDDVEASETPETILLGAVSRDQSQDRTNRALVTPWLKFLWESYRTSFETLKNNARLEAIYQQVAQQAFRFCLKYQRKVEFRRLCEALRLHLTNVPKYAHQAHSINLSDPETLQRHLDTRFAQFNTSVELELWQEAFRSAEDVHSLLTMAKKAPRPAMMANYYKKLTEIFPMGGNSLYHAAAWGRYYAVVSSIGGRSDEEMSRLAGQVLVSAVAVPIGQYSDEDDSRPKSIRLATLLGLTEAPTRAGLLKDALERDVLRLSPTPIKTLYSLLEDSFDPLTLCASTAPILSTLCASDTPYAGYRLPLSRAFFSRLLSQLSQVYSTIKVGTLLELAKPLEDFSGERVEAYLMSCVRRDELRIRIDHATNAISFIDDPFAQPGKSSTAGPRITTVPSPRGTTIQPPSSELARTRLSALATALHNAVRVIDPPPVRMREKEAAHQASQFAELVAAVNAERRALSFRKALVERRRELLSELSIRKEEEDASRRAEFARAKKLLEERKEREDARKREIERVRREVETIRTENARREDARKRGRLNMSIADLSKDRLMRPEVEGSEEEKKDHVERADRKEGPPLIQDYVQPQAANRATIEELLKAWTENSLAAQNQALATKKRLGRMLGDLKAHREMLLDARSEAYKQRKATAAKKMEDEKEKRRQEHATKKEAERKLCEEAAAAARKEEEERLAEQRRQCETERAAATAKKARKKARHQAKVEKRAQLRSQAKTVSTAAPSGEDSGWGIREAWAQGRTELSHGEDSSWGIHEAWAQGGTKSLQEDNGWGIREAWVQGGTELSHGDNGWGICEAWAQGGTELLHGGDSSCGIREESPALSSLSAAGPSKPGAGAGSGWRQRANLGPAGDASMRAGSHNVTSPPLPEGKKNANAPGVETVPRNVWRPRRLQN